MASPRSKAEEIERIIAAFEDAILRHSAARGKPAGCVICRRPDRQEINRAILQGLLSAGAIAKKFSFYNTQIVHHQLTCLPKFGGATITTLQRFEAHRQKLFPTQAKISTQKLWMLNELLFLRDEALKGKPIDRKELARLAKEINAAAEEYRKAKEEHKLRKQKQREPEAESLDEDLTPEQKSQMELVNKQVEAAANGRG